MNCPMKKFSTQSELLKHIERINSCIDILRKNKARYLTQLRETIERESQKKGCEPDCSSETQCVEDWDSELEKNEIIDSYMPEPPEYDEHKLWADDEDSEMYS